MPLPKRLLISAALCLGLAAPASALDLSKMTETEKTAFGEAVRAYLLEKPEVLMEAIGALEKLTIYGDDYDTADGTGVRDYIHVVDLAKGHVRAIAYAEQHKGAKAFNLGTGHGSSVLDIVNTFSRVNGVPVPYVIGPRRAGDIGEYYADCSLAEKELGWKASLTLEDMCRDTWNWQKNNPKGFA